MPITSQAWEWTPGCFSMSLQCSGPLLCPSLPLLETFSTLGGQIRIEKTSGSKYLKFWRRMFYSGRLTGLFQPFDNHCNGQPFELFREEHYIHYADYVKKDNETPRRTHIVNRRDAEQEPYFPNYSRAMSRCRQFANRYRIDNIDIFCYIVMSRGKIGCHIYQSVKFGWRRKLISASPDWGLKIKLWKSSRHIPFLLPLKAAMTRASLIRAGKHLIT